MAFFVKRFHANHMKIVTIPKEPNSKNKEFLSYRVYFSILTTIYSANFDKIFPVKKLSFQSNCGLEWGKSAPFVRESKVKPSILRLLINFKRATSPFAASLRSMGDVPSQPPSALSKLSSSYDSTRLTTFQDPVIIRHSFQSTNPTHR